MYQQIVGAVIDCCNLSRKHKIFLGLDQIPQHPEVR